LAGQLFNQLHASETSSPQELGMHRKSIVAKTLSSVVTIGVLGCEKKTTETGPPIPPEVLVTQVVSADVPVIREWVGTLDRSENADIRARVTGYLQKRDILDCVPLWVAVGAGGVSRQIIGTAVIGGMLATSFIAIFMVPLLFYLVERFSSKKEIPATGKRGAQEEATKRSARWQLNERVDCLIYPKAIRRLRR
jgi:AcrB/AcrD/AcrF family